MPKHTLKFFAVSWLCLLSFLVNGQVTAGFATSDTAGCAPIIVHFTNTSTGATSYSWDLGNGSPLSTMTDAAGSYLIAGTYTVTLTASNGVSSSKYTQVIRAYAAPSVSFSASHSFICPGNTITFTSTSVSNAWGRLAYNWNFGDGNSDTGASPAYTYTTPGSYNVTLFATSGPGCIGSLSKTSYIDVATPATVSFNAANTSFCKAPASASFINATAGTGPFSYTWSFGDGGTSPTANPFYTYIAPGSYDVNLVVTDGNSCKDSLTKSAYITIGNLAAGFTPVPTGCLSTLYTFKNTSSPHISSQWYFGDGTTSTDDTAKHAYTATGTYTVKLVVYNGSCYDSVTHNIVIEKPAGSFTVSPALCPPTVSMTFNATVPAGDHVTWTSYSLGVLGTGSPFIYTFLNKGGINQGGVIDIISMIITDTNGCKDTVTNGKDTVNSLFATLIGAPGRGCAPLTANFSANLASIVYTPFGYFPPLNIISFPYPYSAIGYLWDFGDGSPTSTAAMPMHIYNLPGTYPVSCIIFTSNGCSVTGTDTVRTGDSKPTSSFTLYPSSVCANQQINFTSTSTGTINEYSWSFGDAAGPATTAITTHSYAAPGIYTVKLTASNNGCDGTVYTLIDTVNAPGAIINYKYACVPDNRIIFGDSSAGDDMHLWQFGDGTTTTADNPIHDYPALSTYMATLTTYNITSGCRDTANIPILLQRVSATLTPSRLNICRDVVDTIADLISNVMYGFITVRSATKSMWYINGALADTDVPGYPIPGSASVMADTVYHAIHITGYDTVMVVVTDDGGCKDTASVKILVAKPADNFSFTNGSGCAPLPTAFKDLSTDVAGSTITQYSWSFGDGAASTLGTSAVTHIYTATGTYTIKEIVTDNVGCSDTFTSSSHVVADKPKAAFTANTTFTCIGFTVSFNNTSTGSDSSSWIFGDGATSTAGSPKHTYTTPGVYTVTLVARDGLGCTDTMTMPGYITVNPDPSASFKMSDSFAVCPPLFVNFTNTSTGATSYHWTLGDGTSSSATNPSDIYTTRALYTVKLVAVNAAGCIDSAVHHASIFGYTGAFSYTPVSACVSLPVHFSAVLSGVTNISWDFNDGTISNASLLDTISHIYMTPGAYVPTLLLTDSSGCTSFSTGKDTIKADRVTPAFNFAPNPVCQNSGITFHDSSSSFFSASAAWKWSFGAGATSTAQAPVYTYTASGTHAVTLLVTDSFGCTATTTKSVTVTPLPAIITGDSSVCTGQATALSDATGGGVWSSGNTSIAIAGPGTGVVTGRSQGTASITYTSPGGCAQTKTVTDNSSPPGISGATTICAGFLTTLTDSIAGGIWSSSNTAVASAGPLSGIVKGIIAGTATITYTPATGCAITTLFTVGASPAGISGPANICSGIASAMSDAVAGGAWSSGNTAIAVIDTATGVATGRSSGLVTIRYSLGLGCNVSKTVSVILSPVAISGVADACAGNAITLSDSNTGGKWSSSNTTVASIDAVTGIAAAKVAGTATISYTTGGSCTVTRTATVNPEPSAIMGTAYVCTGLTTVLSDAVIGGAWGSGNSAIATIDTMTGMVTGIAGGTSKITYMLATGCKAVNTVTVNVLPSAIRGTAVVCAGFATTLSDITGGGVWSPAVGGIAIAGTGTGVVSGIAAGTATISYTISTGCSTTKTVTVNSLPLSISGVTRVCTGATATLSDASTGGTWSSSNTAVMAVSSGLVTALSPGTSTITYTLASGCTTTTTVTVDPLPSAITGAASVCTGLTTTLSDTTVGGMWSVSAGGIAKVDAATGIVTGMTAGTATVTYSLTTGCTAITTVTVNSLPLAITGTINLCAGSVTILRDPSAGGSWTSGNTKIVFFDPGTGNAAGASAGTATITYTLPDGCKTTTLVTVDSLPAVIKGFENICAGLTTTLADAGSGTWSSGNTTIALVNAITGVVTGITPGTVIITYGLATGCMTTATVTVNSLPPAITGVTQVCQGSTTALSDSVMGGTWSSSNTSVAVVDGSGVLSGVSHGLAAITYTTGAGCIAMATVTVNPLLAPVTGVATLCKGGTITLADTTVGGVWSSSNDTIASINTSGVVTGIATGSTTIMYSVVNGCGIATAIIVVSALPDAGVITGTTPLCTGTTTLLTETATGGIWASSNDLIATVDASGILTARTPGVDTATYAVINTCGTATAKIILTVYQSPNAVHITTHPDTVLCTNTLFQNFGTDVPQLPGISYSWSTENAVIYAISASKQYCLVSFTAPGAGIVILSAQSAASYCVSADSLRFYIGSGESPEPVVVYRDPEFVCNDNTAQSYQWGYDDAATLDSALFAGEVNENYYNDLPDFAHKNYWVMTYHNGCLQKSYYNPPTGVNIVVNETDGLVLFPNPADSKINIEVKGVNKQGIIAATLYDMIGKKITVNSIADGTGSINLSGLPSGVYMVMLSKKGVKIGSGTFVKN